MDLKALNSYGFGNSRLYTTDSTTAQNAALSFQDMTVSQFDDLLQAAGIDKEKNNITQFKDGVIFIHNGLVELDFTTNSCREYGSYHSFLSSASQNISDAWRKAGEVACYDPWGEEGMAGWGSGRFGTALDQAESAMSAYLFQKCGMGPIANLQLQNIYNDPASAIAFVQEALRLLDRPLFYPDGRRFIKDTEQLEQEKLERKFYEAFLSQFSQDEIDAAETSWYSAEYKSMLISSLEQDIQSARTAYSNSILNRNLLLQLTGEKENDDEGAFPARFSSAVTMKLPGEVTKV